MAIKLEEIWEEIWEEMGRNNCLRNEQLNYELS